MPATPMEKLWSQLLREDALAEFDRHWAALLARLDPAAAPNLLLTAALARFAIDQGHVCLDLADPAAWWPPAATAGGYSPPKAEELRAELRRSPLVATPDVAPEPQPAPLVLARNRLYLWRYWQYEKELAAAILQRAVPVENGPDLPRAEKRLTDLAAAAGLELDGDQRTAVLGALKHHLTVISGGPGTGKTTIVYFILKLLREVAGAKPRILLLAPTGKATARLGETLRDQQEGLPAMTIHRALGYQADTPTSFRHGREQPLAADLVVVDEASMVDMALMSKLLAAVPPTARLVLLGDKDQLASVEAGSILGDIFRAATRLGPCLINLKRGFRFDPARGIGALVQGIKAGDPAAVLAVPVSRSVEGGEVTLNAAADPETQADFQALVLQGFRPCLTAASPAEALARLNDFRLLCAHRRGPAGVEHLNRFCRELLTGAGLLEAPGLTAGDDEWYRGRPILVAANSYEARLFNGDLGIIWDDPEAAGELLAFFPAAAGGGLRRLPLSRLPHHETAFAMTIHKSQGSEFKRVAVILPREDSPLLSRELLYTAVSRARSQVHLFGPEAAIARALARRVTRTSGLAAALAGSGGSGVEEV